MKYLKTIIIVLLAGFIIYLSFFKPDPIENDSYKITIDSLNTVTLFQQHEIKELKKQATVSDFEQDKYIQIADSLETLLNQPKLPCPEVVVIQDKEIDALRSGLKKCNESKGVKTQTIKLQESVINNYVKVSDIQNLQIIECEEQFQRKKIWVWIERLGWVGFILLVAL